MGNMNNKYVFRYIYVLLYITLLIVNTVKVASKIQNVTNICFPSVDDQVYM